VLSNERGATAAGFVSRAIAFSSFGITVERVLSDNGACYRSKAHALTLAELDIHHLFTRPYRPRTNGKAERFIQTLTHRWAYGAIYGSSAERTAALPGWLNHYNFTRPHGSLSHKPPGARLRELTNVPGNYNWAACRRRLRTAHRGPGGGPSRRSLGCTQKAHASRRHRSNSACADEPIPALLGGISDGDASVETLAARDSIRQSCDTRAMTNASERPWLLELGTPQRGEAESADGTYDVVRQMRVTPRSDVSMVTKKADCETGESQRLRW
jgi:hypothetical protein